MKKLDLYIGSSILWSLALVVTILVVIFSFLEFVSQLDDVGKGNYQLKDVLLFIGLTLPRRILDMMPISTLLGSIVALGLLADHGELLAMQAGGMSVRRICWSVFALGTLLILVGTFSGLVSSLPKSGKWLKVFKILFGLILLGVAEYFLIQAGKMLF